MQYLMVLLLLVVLFVAMVGAVIGISYGLGALLRHLGGEEADPADTDPCAQCHADRNWYEKLPIWERCVVTAWWLANRYRCAARGCK